MAALSFFLASLINKWIQGSNLQIGKVHFNIRVHFCQVCWKAIGLTNSLLPLVAHSSPPFFENVSFFSKSMMIFGKISNLRSQSSAYSPISSHTFINLYYLSVFPSFCYCNWVTIVFMSAILRRFSYCFRARKILSVLIIQWWRKIFTTSFSISIPFSILYTFFFVLLQRTLLTPLLLPLLVYIFATTHMIDYWKCSQKPRL